MCSYHYLPTEVLVFTHQGLNLYSMTHAKSIQLATHLGLDVST